MGNKYHTTFSKDIDEKDTCSSLSSNYCQIQFSCSASKLLTENESCFHLKIQNETESKTKDPRRVSVGFGYKIRSNKA